MGIRAEEESETVPTEGTIHTGSTQMHYEGEENPYEINHFGFDIVAPTIQKRLGEYGNECLYVIKQVAADEGIAPTQRLQVIEETMLLDRAISDFISNHTDAYTSTCLGKIMLALGMNLFILTERETSQEFQYFLYTITHIFDLWGEEITHYLETGDFSQISTYMIPAIGLDVHTTIIKTILEYTFGKPAFQEDRAIRDFKKLTTALVMNMYVLNGSYRSDLPQVQEFTSILTSLQNEKGEHVQSLIEGGQALELSNMVLDKIMQENIALQLVYQKKIRRVIGAFVIEHQKQYAELAGTIKTGEIPFFPQIVDLLEAINPETTILTYKYENMPEALIQTLGEKRYYYFVERKGWIVGDEEERVELDSHDLVSNHYVVMTEDPENPGYARTKGTYTGQMSLDFTVKEITETLERINALPFGKIALNADMRTTALKQAAEGNPELLEKLHQEADITISKKETYPSTSRQIAEKLYKIFREDVNELGPIERQLRDYATNEQGIPLILVERFMPPNITLTEEKKAVGFSKFKRPLLGMSILNFIMVEISAQEFVNKDSTLWLIQCDNEFKKVLKGLFGEEAILNLASITQAKIDVKSETKKLVEDICNTVILDIKLALKYLYVNNLPFARAVVQRVKELDPQKGRQLETLYAPKSLSIEP